MTQIEDKGFIQLVHIQKYLRSITVTPLTAAGLQFYWVRRGVCVLVIQLKLKSSSSLTAAKPSEEKIEDYSGFHASCQRCQFSSLLATLRTVLSKDGFAVSTVFLLLLLLRFRSRGGGSKNNASEAKTREPGLSFDSFTLLQCHLDQLWLFMQGSFCMDVPYLWLNSSYPVLSQLPPFSQPDA